MKDDTVSRAAAIDEAEEWIEVVYCEDGDQRERDAIGHVIHGIKELPSVQTCEDAVSRQAAIAAVSNWIYDRDDERSVDQLLSALPAVQPEPLSDAYTKAVWTWLLDYQIKAAKLKGRYTPYEVLSWVANDWRKEHEGSD